MKKISFLLICSVFLFQACKKDEISSEKITGDIIISTLERLDSTRNTFEISCKTEEIYNCMNFGIQTNYTVTGQKIYIDFNNITTSDMCLTALGPAKSKIILENLENGIYDIEIKVGYKNNTGKLIVTNQSFELEIEDPEDLQIERNPLLRVPENTIWGVIGYHSATTNALAQSYIDSLKILGAITISLTEGDYGYFTTDINSNIIKPTNNGYWFSIPYVFKYTNDMKTLEEMIKNYGIDYSDSVSIKLYSSEGDYLWAY